MDKVIKKYASVLKLKNEKQTPHIFVDGKKIYQWVPGWVDEIYKKISVLEIQKKILRSCEDTTDDEKTVILEDIILTNQIIEVLKNKLSSPYI